MKEVYKNNFSEYNTKDGEGETEERKREDVTSDLKCLYNHSSRC